MREALTDIQFEIFYYIKITIKEMGYPPTVREIADAVGLKSTSSVHAHLDTMERKGYIRRDPTKPRAIEILDDKFLDTRPTVQVPIIGTVAAGVPILAQENIEDYFPMPEEMVHGEDVFMLRVKGESMINAGIYDGDYVLVRQQDEVETGEIAVAMVDDSATIKRFYKEGNRVRLQPENDTMAPMYFDDVSIIGKVVGLLRMM